LERKLFVIFDFGLFFLDLGAKLVNGSLDDGYFFEVAIMIN